MVHFVQMSAFSTTWSGKMRGDLFHDCKSGPEVDCVVFFQTGSQTWIRDLGAWSCPPVWGRVVFLSRLFREAVSLSRDERQPSVSGFSVDADHHCASRQQIMVLVLFSFCSTIIFSDRQ